MPHWLFSLLIAAALAAVSAAQTPDSLGRPVYETADVPPELIGGLAAVTQAIVYPESARAAGLEGTVVVQFVVDETGAVTAPVVLRSPGQALSQAALDAVRQQQFRPGRDGGKPVRVVFTLPVTFRLAPAASGPAAPPTEGIDPLYACASALRDPEVAGGLAALRDRLTRLSDAPLGPIRVQVVVGFTVDTDGRPAEIEVDRPLPAFLGRAVVQMIQGAQFRPAHCEGQPMRSTVVVPFLLPAQAFETGGVSEDGCRTWTAPRLVGGTLGLHRRVRYPEFARRQDIEGTVVVRVVAGKDGRPIEAVVAQSVHPSLDQEALGAVQRSRFVPAQCDGHPQAAPFVIPVSFRLF